jgi:serine/threonine protein kinase
MRGDVAHREPRADLLTSCPNPAHVRTESQILELMAQILLALQYLHSKSILHRDLKTANIFLTTDVRGQGGGERGVWEGRGGERRERRGRLRKVGAQQPSSPPSSHWSHTTAAS